MVHKTYEKFWTVSEIMKCCVGKSKVAWIREHNYVSKGIRSSSPGNTCHRDEYSFIRYRDDYWMMIDRDKVRLKYHDDKGKTRI